VTYQSVASSQQADDLDSTSLKPEPGFSSHQAVLSSVAEISNHDIAVDSLTKQLTIINLPPEPPAEEPASSPLKYQADWERWDARKRPIDRFTPSVEVPEFYHKLKAATNHQLTINN
jgi:hypothetical protein